MPEKIAILKESGETLNSNIVSFFMIPDTEKKYLITTENAVDPHGLTVLHVSELVDGSLQRVSTDEEWSTIKTIMRAIISGNVGTFQYLPSVENANASGQYSRDISVSSTAANQMITSYNNGEKSLGTQQPEEAIQPIEDIGGGQQPANGNVVSVSTVSQPQVVPGMVATAIGPDGMPINGVGIDPSGAGVSPIVTSDQVLSPGVNPVLPINPVMNSSETPGVVGQDVPLNQTGAMPIVSNLMPDAGVDPMNGMTGMPNGVVVPGMDGTVPVDENGMVIPQGQIVQPTEGDDSTINPNVTGSFAPDASLDEVVAASQEMFMEGVKNLVQTIQEKVYRELYIKEEELKKREAELEQREQAMNNMVNPMQAFSSMMQMNPNFMNQMAQMAQMGSQMQSNPGMNSLDQTQKMNPVSTPQMGQGTMMNSAPINPMDQNPMMNPMMNNMVSPMDQNPMMSNTGMQQPMIVQASNDNFNN